MFSIRQMTMQAAILHAIGAGSADFVSYFPAGTTFFAADFTSAS
jgi:hypothetical protein